MYYPKEKLWHKDYILIVLAATCISASNYFFTNTLPIYAKLMTGTTTHAGLVTTIYTLTALIMRPIAGNLSDRIGRTRLLVLGAIICAAACSLYLLAGTFILLVIFRIIHGIGFGIHSTCGGAVVADIVPETRMTEGLGFYFLSATIPMAVGPGIALHIIGDGDMAGFRKLFITVAVILLVCMVLDLFISYERKAGRKSAPTREKYNDTETKQDIQRGKTKSFLGFETVILPLFTVNTLQYAAISTVSFFLALYGIENNMGNVGPFYAMSAVGVFLSRFLLGKIAERVGLNTIVIAGSVLLITCLALIPFVHSLWLLIFLALPYGLAHGGIGPAISSLMFERSSPEKRGSTSAAYFSAIDFGFGAGALFFGFIADVLSFRAVYLGASLTSILALLVFLYDVKRREKYSSQAKS